MPPSRDRLVWHLGRVDDWIQNADTKASILLALDAALFAASAATVFPHLRSGSPRAIWLTLVPLVVSVFSGLATVLPSLKPRSGSGSPYFFGYVARQRPAEFRQAYEKMTDETDREALIAQIYESSSIASRKFWWLSLCAWATVAATAMLGLQLALVTLHGAPHVGRT